MTALTAAADHEIGRLLEENRHLAQDLKQCQADKDFVWSLWKKLQVTNPDVTEAVGLVVQREREKAEQRDRKVLEILQRKDDRIDELQANLAYKTRELGQSTVKQGDVGDEVYQLQRQVDMLQDRNSTLELQLKKVKRSKCVSESARRDQTNQRLSNMSPKRSKSVKEVETPDIRTRQTKHARSSKVRNIEGRERNLEGAHSETIQTLEREKRELSQRVQSMGHDLDKARSDKADEMALRVQLESKVTALDRDVQQKLGKFEQLVTELEEARSVLRKFESQVRQQQQDLDYKNTELETVRRELAELWTTHNQLTEHSSQQADLIRQIQSLQTDTQKMMKNQEEAYCMESSSIQQMYTDLTARYDQAKKAESELRSQVLTLKKEIMDREDIISDLKRQLDKRHTRDLSGSYLDQEEKVEPVLDLEFKCRGMQKEIDNLRRQLLEREGQIEALEEDAINQTIEFDVARLNRHECTHSTPSKQVKSVALSPMRGPTEWPGKSQRSRSMSPRREVLTSKPRLHIQKDLDDCRMILKLKIRELNELKKAHAKRLERLKTVQDSYRNVKEQLKTLEDEYYGSKKKRKKVKRADPRDLRQEDSPAVWNELAYFKNENRNMAIERMSLEEELDGLRVQASQDAATVHELRVALQQEKEERAYDRKKTEREVEGVSNQRSELVLLRSEVQNGKMTAERLTRELHEARADREALTEEKKLLKQEMMALKQDASQHRMDQADLRRDIHRLKRELDEERAISRLHTGKATSPIMKTVTLKPSGKSRRKHNGKSRTAFNVSASKKFEELVEEGWEEMSGESDNEGGTESGTDTLGERIVQKSRHHKPDMSTTDSSMDQHKHRRGTQMKHSRLHHPTSPVREPAQFPPPARHTEARAHRALYRDAGTSPVHQPVQLQTSPTAKKSPAYNALVRQLRPMKQRVGYLQQQVLTLRESRAVALKLTEELKERNVQLETDLGHAQLRLRTNKQSIQKLNGDMDKLLGEKKDLEQRLTQKLDNLLPETGRSDHDWKVLEARLKSCSTELSRQNNVVRQLKQENEQLTDQVKLLQDKVGRAERDSSQKRTLLEDQRTRVRQALESAKADADSLEQLDTKTKLLQDTNEKQKIQIDSYKKRLGAVTREKRDYEERFLKLTAEVEKKNKLLLDSQARRADVETSLSAMEEMATRQMKLLARESEDALETAKDKLREIHQVLQAYQRFVRNLAAEILRRTQQARAAVKEQDQRRAACERENISLKRAQNLAKDILNLSQSDLDEIMSADGDHTNMESESEVERRRDRKWAKKVDRTQNGKDDFALALMDLFLQKIEERHELMARLRPAGESPMT